MSAKFSVIMATLNSIRTIEASLKSLRAQDYPQDQIEILVIDGGSTDGTREIAIRYGARIVENPRVEPVTAKLIGLREATGNYLIHVDSDEVLQSPRALAKRAKVFQENPNIRMVFGSGYANAPNATFAARYINEFGDPFSMFFYRLSKSSFFFISTMRRRLPMVRNDKDYAVFRVAGGAQPILENAACGNTIDLGFFRREFPELSDKPWGPVHFFYHMQAHTSDFAITKDDAIVHYSADRWSGFLRKIDWRVRNNIFFLDDMGASGFSGRQIFEKGLLLRLRPYLYIPYVLLLLPVTVDAVILMWTRRDPAFILHIPLSFYTLTMILSMRLLKAVGYKPRLTGYGQQKAVATPGIRSSR